jgi:hypothetical protein
LSGFELSANESRTTIRVAPFSLPLRDRLAHSHDDNRFIRVGKAGSQAVKLALEKTARSDSGTSVAQPVNKRIVTLCGIGRMESINLWC